MRTSRGWALVGMLTVAGCVVKQWHPTEPTAESYLDYLYHHEDPRVYASFVMDDGQRIQGAIRMVDVDRNEVTLHPDRVVDMDRVVSGRVGEVDVAATDGAKAAGIAVGASVGGAAVVAIILLLVIGLKGSCPFVFVLTADGQVLVGEGYSGAVAGALQRADLLALGPAPAGALRVRVANHAEETQFTDLASLVIVEHGPSERALPTMDGRVMLVGPAMTAPATDLSGADVSAAVAAADLRVWATDLLAAGVGPVIPLEEGLVARVQAAPSDAALELTYANSPWFDVLAGQLWGGLGAHIERVHEGNRDPARREALEARMREAGIYTQVEVDDGSGYRTVAWLPPPGWAARRQVVVPLPGLAAGRPAQVRLRGGVGFLQVDALGLTSIVDAEPAFTAQPAASAVQWDGADARALLAAADGSHQVLAERDQWVDLSFDLPPPAREVTRDAFLRLDGFYEVHHRPHTYLDGDAVAALGRDPAHTRQLSVERFRDLYELLRRSR